MIKFKREDIVKYIFVALLIAEIIFLIWANLCHIVDAVDQDFAKLIRHMYEMAENHTLFLKNWEYITTAELDCAALPAILFYYITRNSFLAYALANIFDIFLWLFVAVCLMRALHLKAEYRALFYCLLFLTYDWGMLQYTNMMFFAGGQYVYKALVPVLLVTILLKDKGNKYVDGILYALYAFLLLMTSISSGIFVFITGIFPILLIVWFIELAKNSSFKLNKDRIFYGIITIMSLVITGLGLFICSAKGVDPNSASVVLKDIDHDFIEAILTCFNYLLALFHPAYVDVELKSLTGLAMCFNWLIVFLIVLGLFSIRRFGQLHSLVAVDEAISPDYFRARAEIILVTIALWDFAIVFLTISQERYLLIGAIPLMACGVMNLERILWHYNKLIENISLAVIAVSIIVVLIYNIKVVPQTYFEDEWNYEGMTPIAEDVETAIEAENVDTCIVLNWSELVERMRARDLENTLYCYQIEPASILTVDYYMVDQEELLASKHILIGTAEEFALLPEDMQDNYDLTDMTIDYEDRLVWVRK